MVRYDSLDEYWHQLITQDAGTQNTVAADGLPLEVVGQIRITVSLGEFGTNHEFTVVNICQSNAFWVQTAFLDTML